MPDTYTIAAGADNSHEDSLKAPTFCAVLHRWLSVFVTDPPVLLWIQKERSRVEESYLSRGESAASVPTKWDQCQAQFDNWPWAKFSLRAEDIVAAVAMFDVSRSVGEVTDG